MALLTLWWPLTVQAVDWLAVALHWRRLEWVAKPASLLAIIVWLACQAAWAGTWPLPLGLFLVGLTLSLAGDVLLILPERFFLAGLVSFLLAHVAYAAGFMSDGLPGGSAWLLALPVAVTGLALARLLAVRMRSGGHARLVMPVLVYTAVISLMVFAALATLSRPEWPVLAAALASLGALLFMFSDAVLAWRRFVAPVRGADLAVIVTYHIGQMCLAAAAAGRWLG